MQKLVFAKTRFPLCVFLSVPAKAVVLDSTFCGTQWGSVPKECAAGLLLRNGCPLRVKNQKERCCFLFLFPAAAELENTRAQKAIT